MYSQFWIWHSQIMSTPQPISLNSCSCCLSRFMFLPIFASQYALLDFGLFECLQFLCPCQKQPWTNIIFLNFGKTISGFPGRSFRCSRNRYPAAWSSLLTRSSGTVLELRTRAMFSLRFFGVRVSMMRRTLPFQFNQEFLKLGFLGRRVQGGFVRQTAWFFACTQ